MSNLDIYGQIVERVRAGDQVAMAHMTEVRDKAAKGDRLARASMRELNKYIKEHPAQSDVGFDLVLNTKLIGASARAMKVMWTVPKEKFTEIFIKASPFVSMWQGVACVLHRATLDEKDPLVLSTNVKKSRMGAIVRKAMQIRALRDRAVPLSKFCPATGWEHGE